MNEHPDHAATGGDVPDATEPTGPTEAVDATDPTHAAESTEPAGGGAAGGAGGWRARGSAAWRWVRWPVYAGGALAALGLLPLVYLWVTIDIPDVAAGGESAVVLDRNGDELAVLAQDGLRLEVPLEDMADHVPDALVAAEDRRFYDHDGVDPIGIARALWNNVRDDDLEGGSTITQQLVKNVYLDDDRTITRKVREAVLAMKLERSEDKDEILERYLNTVYFGRGAYGIEAAARTYFDLGASELEPAQTALLVGILRAPEALDPAEDPKAAKARRDAVLETMGSMGTLDPAEVDAALATPVEVAAEVSPTTLSAGVAPHFVEKVRAEVVERFGEQALYDRGLVIRTTLDIEDQKAAEAAVARHLDAPEDPQAAVIGVDRSGAVRAWVGGRDFEALQVDLVADPAGSGRQPGSTFKPIVLATNLERGHGAGQVFPAPAELTLDIPPEPWTVSNAGGRGYGSLTLFEGTVNSVNTVYAQALAQVGPDAVADMAGRLGVERELDPQPSIALGTEEVSVYEMATVYSTLARSGSKVSPFRITAVETTDGDVLWERADQEPDRVIDAEVADTVSAVLSEVPQRGTATRARLDRPMAAKTGTTQRNADAWLAGYTPEYTAIVWVGNADGNTPMGEVDGVGVQGGTVPAAIWHDFMVEALADVEPTPFPAPSDELLGDPGQDARLDVRPARVDPGGRVTVVGTGFERCLNGWSVVIEGPVAGSGVDGPEGGAPFRVESPPDGGSDEAERRAEIGIPADAATGEYRVSANCDFGTGLEPYGPTATLRIGAAPDSSTTTTTSSTTTTTRPDRGGNGSTSTTSTTSTTTSSSTTTTTVPTAGATGAGDADDSGGADA